MKKPRPHQRKAINAVVTGFKTHAKGKLIMACGTGKTLVANWVREETNSGCTLFMAPSIALLAQTLQAWREVSKTPFEALAICSDGSVAHGRDADDLPAANVGAAVTTDYRDIAKFISSTGRRVVLCTYQSSEALTEAMSLVSVPAFDLAIADEAHRTTGGKGGTFTTITDSSAIRAAKRLFMTATPRLYFNDDEKDIVSMDNEELYGPVLHELDFAEAIKRGLLSDYEVLVVGVSPEAEKEAERLITTNPRLKVADRTLTARKLAVNIAVLRTIKERGLERVITFHNSCSKAAATADFFPALQDWMPKKYRTATKVWAKTVNHTMDTSARHELMRQFKALNGPGILTNARCLGEGVDVPTVDAVVFMDAKKSKIEIVQTVGRAIRLSPGKEKAYIILPVIMLPGDDAGQIDSASFKPAFDVLSALRAHDSTLLDQLQHWTENGSHGNTGGTSGVDGDEGRKVTFDIPGDCDTRIADWFVLAVRNCGAHWTVHWPAMEKAIRRKRQANAPLTPGDIQWLRDQAYGIQSGRLKPPRVARVTPLLEHFRVGVNTIEGRAAASLKQAQEVLAKFQALGYRHGRPAAELMRVLKDGGTAAWTTTREAQNIRNKLAKLPTYCTWATRTKLAGAADAIDAYVAKYRCRPPTTVAKYGALRGRAAMAVWVPKAVEDPSLLHNVRPAEWPAKILALPVQTATFKAAMAARAATARRAVPLKLAELTAFVKKFKRFPRVRVTEEAGLYNWVRKIVRFGAPRSSARVAIRGLRAAIRKSESVD